MKIQDEEKVKKRKGIRGENPENIEEMSKFMKCTE